MARYRPIPCAGRGLPQCGRCLRFTANPGPYQHLTHPELVDGRCTDHIEGRPVRVPATPMEAPAHEAR